MTGRKYCYKSPKIISFQVTNNMFPPNNEFVLRNQTLSIYHATKEYDNAVY